MARLWVLSWLFFTTSLSATMYHRIAQEEWQEKNLPPFDELMISWNGARPVEGKYLIYISVWTDEWSPQLLYASWGAEGQSSYLNNGPNVRVYQDAVAILEGKKATGFQIRIAVEGGAQLSDLLEFHVYTNADRGASIETLPSESVFLPVTGLSQMTVDHPRCKDLCSPTSTTAVVRYLSNRPIDPCQFAQAVWDRGFDLFGNWVFNAAQAAAELGSSWSVWVERLNGFEAICQRLKEGAPVVVSVRGPLSGSALPYAKGHLLVVIGYDAERQKVLCMDPAFPTDGQTHVSYDLADFNKAWDRRGRIAYVFQRRE